MSKTFVLIGDGKQAEYHKKAVDHVGGQLLRVYDPKHLPGYSLDDSFFKRTLLYPVDYVIVCSPTNLHREHTKLALSNGCKVIVEKPMCLPWEPIIDNDDINISLQLRYLPNLPKQAENVYVKMVRNEEYFKTWKGNPILTGGLFFNLFIHYIDLAILLNANFMGHVTSDPVYQERWVDSLNLLDIDMQLCYNRMYEDILQGGGIKPKHKFYLRWVLQRYSEIHGYGKNGIEKVIKIDRELL